MRGPKKQAVDTRMEVTLKIDQTILADFQMMIEDYKSQCENGDDCPDQHTLESGIEELMKNSLRGYLISKALDKYGI